ncbi:MAG: hypothetical protein SOT41_04845 [Candidatus Faecisoma sp.]|nr:hypothetical protein [Acholeplasma sp.]MDY2893085.1 hypothetical protein [Candidatus Faecisoma sp.]
MSCGCPAGFNNNNNNNANAWNVNSDGNTNNNNVNNTNGVRPASKVSCVGGYGFLCVGV